MWFGYDFFDYIEDLSEEKLLGVSINVDLNFFEDNLSEDEDKDITKLSFYDKINFIDKNHKLWKSISIEETTPVKYEGYLVNHSKKLAIDLEEYYKNSASVSIYGKEFLIDLIPPLTETGQGTEMAIFDGGSADVTEKLVGVVIYCN